MKDTHIEKLQKEYYDLLNTQHFDGECLDYAALEKHLPFIHQLDQYNHSAVSVFDLYKKEHIYLSPNYYHFFDLSEAESSNNSSHDARVHPEDYPLLLQMAIDGFRNLMTVPVERKKKLRVINEYRIKQKGKYVRVVEQLNVLELDTKDNIWLTLNVMNHSADTTSGAPFRSVWQDVETGELTKWEAVPTVLSAREKQVLRLIYEGYASKQIADKLFISVNTVNNHRQNMIQKLGVSNTVEAIHYLQRLGAL